MILYHYDWTTESLYNTDPGTVSVPGGVTGGRKMRSGSSGRWTNYLRLLDPVTLRDGLLADVLLGMLPVRKNNVVLFLDDPAKLRVVASYVEARLVRELYAGLCCAAR